MKFLLFLSVLLFTIIGLYAQAEKEQVAVLDLDADGLSVSESATLTNRLRSELVKIDSFTIVERSKMNEILDEQGFQMTGCTSSECAVEAGKILSVNRICTGNVGKVGEIYTLTIRLINVETGAIIKSVTEDCQCPIEQVLTRSIPIVAAKLSGKKVKENAGYDLIKGKGDIYLNSEPSGAEIYIDNINMGKVTPVMISDIIAGSHEIKVIKGEYVGLKLVTVIANGLVQENIVLDKNKTGGLKVYSEQIGAIIYINGKVYGKTPKIIKNLPIGDYKMVLKILPDLVYEQKVDIEYNKFTKIDCKLKKHATLQILSEPTSADILLDDMPIGITPMPYNFYPRDNIKISIKIKNYIEWKKNISLEEGEKRKIEVKLKREKGTLRFSSYLKGSILILNEKNYKMDRNELTLPVGFYSLEISYPGYLSKEWDVQVRVGETTMIDASLEKKTKEGAFTRSFFIPGWGQGYQGKNKRAWLYSLSFMGTVGGSLYFTKQYNEAVIDYNDLREQYEKATDDIDELRNKMIAKYDDVNSLETTRNIFYISAGAIWLWNIVDVLFLPPAWEKKIELSAAPINNGIMLGMAYKW